MITKFKLFEEKSNKSHVICGFPGIGKSYFYKKMINGGYNVLDSDSTNFSWIEKGVRNPDFPNNYIDHIKKNINKADVILISSHDVVRKSLVENKIPFILVYPDKSIKKEYIARYRQRGSDENFVKLLENNWDKFINDCEKQKGCRHVVIHSGEYLSDKIDELIQDDKINEQLIDIDPYGEEEWEVDDKDLYIIYVIGQDMNFLSKRIKKGKWDVTYAIAYKERNGRLVFDRGQWENNPYPAENVEKILKGKELVGYITGINNVRFDTLQNIIAGTGINIDDINFY